MKEDYKKRENDENEREYREKYNHPRIHYAPLYGWMNDPNGLVFDGKLYNMFYQHNPKDIVWDKIHWGHAVSRDLIHWETMKDALEPDKYGYIYSGSGIVDENNLLGMGIDTIVVYYTAATGAKTEHMAFTQRMAYSTDGGKTFHKDEEFEIPCFVPENRDPKIIWYGKDQVYILVMYLDEDRFWLWRSEDLRHFEKTQELRMPGFYECPDLFEIEGEGEHKWVFSSATGYYVIGSFDGYCFTPQGSPKERFHDAYPSLENISCKGYAAQTYTGTGNRRINQYWIMYPKSEQNQTYQGNMSMPQEIRLKKTNMGEWYLTYFPVKELEQLRKTSHAWRCASGENCFFNISGDAVELRFSVSVGKTSVVSRQVSTREQMVEADVDRIILQILGKEICIYTMQRKVEADGKYVSLTEEKEIIFAVYVDIDVIEIFIQDGCRCIVVENQTHDLQGEISFTNRTNHAVEIVQYELAAIW